MRKNETGKAVYRLAARMCGRRLTLEQEVLDELQDNHLRAMQMLDDQGGSCNGRALARSIEWERWGDFLADAGRKIGAAKAYVEAVNACLDGDYYDYGSEHLPSRRLRLRFYELTTKLAAFCQADSRLRALCEDSLIWEEYARFSAHDRP